MTAFKALSKQFFGAKYEKIVRSLLISGIFFYAIYGTGFQLEIGTGIMYFTAVAFSAGIMFQMLTSKHNEDMFAGLFALPFDNSDCKFGLVSIFTLYSVLTKSLPIIMVFLALKHPSPGEIVFTLLFAIISCIQAAALFCLFFNQRVNRLISVPVILIWITAMYCGILFFKHDNTVLTAMLIGLVISIIILWASDPYIFYRTSKTGSAGKKLFTGGEFCYFIRIMSTNVSYILNTAVLCGFTIVMIFIQKSFDNAELNFLPIGMAVLLLNTPICTMLSYDRDTQEVMRALPRQEVMFMIKYNAFIFIFNLLVETVYLSAWGIIIGGIKGINILWIVMFALQGAILSAYLEWRHPIKNWKAEPDLWHNPRKYIVPGIMILVAGLIIAIPFVTWIWLSIIVIEVIILFKVSTMEEEVNG